MEKVNDAELWVRRKGWAKCSTKDTGLIRQSIHAALVSKLSKAEREARAKGGGLVEIMLSTVKKR